MDCSVISKTTAGGCTFDVLCRGDIASYACDNVIDLTKGSKESGGVLTLSEATMKLVKHVDDCIKTIETE